MKRVLWALLWALLFAPLPALARPLHPPSGPDPDPTPLVRDSELAEYRERRLEYNRRDKTVMLAVELAGFGSRGFQQALRVGFFLSRNWILELQAGQGGAALYGDVYLAKNYTFGQLSLKYFTGNSFYLFGGLAYDHVVARDVVWTADASFIGEMGSALVGIGNQWQWKSFTLGCDWVAAGLAIHPHITRSDLSGTLSSSNQNTFDEAQDDFDRQTSLFYVTRFYLGFTF